MRPDPYTVAEMHLTDAKASYTDACLAALRGDPAAPLLADRALAEVRAALAELETIATGAGE